MKTLKQLNEAYADEYLDNDIRLVIIDKLKNALKEELNAWYGYIIIKDFLVGPYRSEITKLYEETAKDELEDHGYWLIKRINELGGTLDDLSMTPASWVNSTHPYVAPKWKGDIVPIKESLELNIQNELGAIESYKEIIELTKDVDYTTHSKCKQILADEEEHLQLLKEFLDDIKN